MSRHFLFSAGISVVFQWLSIFLNKPIEGILFMLLALFFLGCQIIEWRKEYRAKYLGEYK